MKRCGPKGALVISVDKQGEDYGAVFAATVQKNIIKAFTLPESMFEKTWFESTPHSPESSFADLMKAAQVDLAYQIEKHIFGAAPMQKALGFVDDEGLTSLGEGAMADYANAWVAGRRDLDIERRFPEMTGMFYAVRSDPEFAERFTTQSFLVVKSTAPPEMIAKGKAHWLEVFGAAAEKAADWVVPKHTVTKYFIKVGNTGGT